MVNNFLYFGQFSAYEEYYAFGDSPEKVKRLLWLMYCHNYYGRPTKEDKQEFEEVTYIQRIVRLDNIGQTYGFTTKDSSNVYRLQGDKIVKAKGVDIE